MFRKSISKIVQTRCSTSLGKQQILNNERRISSLSNNNNNNKNSIKMDNDKNLISMGWKDGNVEKLFFKKNQSRIITNNFHQSNKNNNNINSTIFFQSRSFSTEQESNKKNSENNEQKNNENNEQQTEEEINEEEGAPKDFPNADKDYVFDNPESDQRPKFPEAEPEKFEERKWNPDVPDSPTYLFYLLPLVCAGLGIWQYFRWQEKLELLDLRIKRLTENAIGIDQYIRNLLT